MRDVNKFGAKKFGEVGMYISYPFAAGHKHSIWPKLIDWLRSGKEETPVELR
jgi:hypothetical protein